MTYGIHDAIMQRLVTRLTQDLITGIDESDPARVGAIKLGPLQGEPEPDTARISLTIHENDPNASDSESWDDQVYDIECGGAITYERRFTIKVRALMELTKENLDEARKIASTLVERIEGSLLKEMFTGVSSGNEYVARGVFAESLTSKIHQGGGPPDAYDFTIRTRFDVLTTRTGVYQ